MTTINITSRGDLEVGDTATFAYNGHEITGVVWSQAGRAMIGKMPLGTAEEWDLDLDFVRATREAPSLPTESGSVVLVTEYRGERLDKPVVAVLGGFTCWYTSERFLNGTQWHDAEHITEWTPAKVVAA